MMAAANNGNCYLCGAEHSPVKMKNHILKEHNDPAGSQDCYLLKIEGAYDKGYWLFVELPLKKRLFDLDAFLREIWLECCGHLSAFYGPDRTQLDVSRQIGSFQVGAKLTHEYDFGSTTETVIAVVAATKRKTQRGAVRLLARNIPPAFPCAACGKPADSICTECMVDSDNPFYCAECAEEHEHDDMLLPVTNSPRMGECGYSGELDTFAFQGGKG